MFALNTSGIMIISDNRKKDHFTEQQKLVLKGHF
jgi:hypothetical protein